VIFAFGVLKLIVGTTLMLAYTEKVVTVVGFISGITDFLFGVLYLFDVLSSSSIESLTQIESSTTAKSTTTASKLKR
jgi:hypothetical protein